MPMSQSASSSPTPRTTSRVMMTGLIGPDLRQEDWPRPSHHEWTRQWREPTRSRYSAQTHAFNPKFNDFGFDPDQVSKLENANLKTWPVSRRCHFRPPDPRLNYEPDWTRRMSAGASRSHSQNG